MAAKAKALPTKDRLEALGAQRLAELLAEAAAQDPALKRRLKLELAEKQAPESVAARFNGIACAAEGNGPSWNVRDSSGPNSKLAIRSKPASIFHAGSNRQS